MSTKSFYQSGGCFVIEDSSSGIVYSSNNPVLFKPVDGKIQIIASNLGYSGNPYTIATYPLSEITTIGGNAVSGTLDGAIVQLNGIVSMIQGGGATSALQSTANASLSTIATNTTSVDYKYYTASIRNLNFAAAATAILEIIGSATKRIKIIEIEGWLSSTAATVTLDMSLIKQSTPCTGGTSTTLTSVAMDSTSPASTATVKAYTVNPTLGTSVGIIGIHNTLATITSTTTINPVAIEEEFDIAFAPTLNNANESVILSLNSNTVAATRSADIYIKFAEY